VYFDLKKLIDYKGNRYELARAGMEYAKKVRYLETDEYHKVNEKDALVSLKAVLDEKIHFTMSDADTERFEEEDEVFVEREGSYTADPDQ